MRPGIICGFERGNINHPPKRLEGGLVELNVGVNHPTSMGIGGREFIKIIVSGPEAKLQEIATLTTGSAIRVENALYVSERKKSEKTHYLRARVGNITITNRKELD
jgi:hypothetical protein